STLISACFDDMNLSWSTRLHVAGSVPMSVAEPSVNSSPRCGPWSGTSQPMTCMPPCPLGPGPPPWLSMNAIVFGAGFAAAAAMAAACACAAWAQCGHWNHSLSMSCSHCEQYFLANGQKPRETSGGLGLIGPPAPGGGAPGAPGGAPGNPGIPGG